MIQLLWCHKYLVIRFPSCHKFLITGFTQCHQHLIKDFLQLHQYPLTGCPQCHHYIQHHHCRITGLLHHHQYLIMVSANSDCAIWGAVFVWWNSDQLFSLYLLYERRWYSQDSNILEYVELVNGYWNFGGRSSFKMLVTSSSHGILFQKTWLSSTPLWKLPHNSQLIQLLQPIQSCVSHSKPAFYAPHEAHFSGQVFALHRRRNNLTFKIVND